MKLDLSVEVIDLSGNGVRHLCADINEVNVDWFDLPFDYINIPDGLYTDHLTIEDFVSSESTQGRCVIDGDMCYLYRSKQLPVIYVYNTVLKDALVAQYDKHFNVTPLEG